MIVPLQSIPELILGVYIMLEFSQCMANYCSLIDKNAAVHMLEKQMPVHHSLLIENMVMHQMRSLRMSHGSVFDQFD